MSTENHPHVPHVSHGAFGNDTFGRLAERFARFFGTPRFLIAQTLIVLGWIVVNAGQLVFGAFDPFPFILLNLVFSTQAAYAAPLILLAQTRQADRDKTQSHVDATHREALAAEQNRLLEESSAAVREVARLTREVHTATVGRAGPGSPPS
jgi:uncharacterized membrane protein